MPRDVEIIKKEVVVLGGDDQGPPVEDDDYLHFFDEGGSSHRIKLNRKSAVELIKNNPNRVVQLNYGSYMNNEFIHNVELVKTPPAVKPPTDSTPPKADLPQKVMYVPKPDPTRKSIERQKALDIAERWCEACKQAGEEVKTTHIISIAKIFESYLDSGVNDD